MSSTVNSLHAYRGTRSSTILHATPVRQTDMQVTLILGAFHMLVTLTIDT